MSEIGQYLQFWLFLAYCSYLALTPAPNDLLVETFSDKFLHCAGYLLLLISCNLAHRAGRHLLLKVSLLFTFSVLIEIAQHFIPHRGFAISDLIANLSGLLLGVILLLLYKSFRTGKTYQGS